MVLDLVVVAVAWNAAEPPLHRDECLFLTELFDTDGFATSHVARDGDFDGLGGAYLAEGLPPDARLFVRSARFGPIEFIRPRTTGAEPNFISCKGQTIRVRTRRTFDLLFSLGAAHGGDLCGWITFTFDDGTKARGPIGFTDWFSDPLFGEEIAFRLAVFDDRGFHPPGGARLFLQRTPIPVDKRIVSIELPDLPDAKIMALTLGWREGVRRILDGEAPVPPPQAPVAIFFEPGFPSFSTGGEISAARIRAAFDRAGLPASFLGVDHLKDPAILGPDAFPVLVNPYGSAFPAAAEENLRAYRKAGGAMIHRGVPFRRPVARSPYGTWIDAGRTDLLFGHLGDRAMGTGEDSSVPWRPLVPQPALRAWGLGDVEWSRFLTWLDRVQPPPASRQILSPASLASSDEVIPLISLDAEGKEPFAAIIRHRSCAFAGAIDVWIGPSAIGSAPQEVPAELVTELIVRAAAWILRERGRIDDLRWQEIARPAGDRLRAPDAIEPVWPDPAWSWHLPRASRIGRRVHIVDVRPLSDSERVLLASAQGLVNRAGGEDAIYLAQGDRDAALLEWYKTERLIGSFRSATARDVLSLVGHRNAVVVDPDLQGSLNVATAIAAAQGLMIAHPHDLAAHGLRVAEDLRGRFRSASEAYAWAFQTLGPRLSGQALAIEDPQVSAWQVRDYLVANGILPLWISGPRDRMAPGAGSEEEQAVVTRILARTPVCTAVLATDRQIRRGMDEGFWTLLLSAFGKYRVPIGPRANLSFASGVAAPAKGSARRAASPPAFEADKVYLSCVYRTRFAPLSLVDPTGIEPAPWRQSPWRPKGGEILLPAVADLLPAPAARALSEDGMRECIGSRGLGDIDLEAFGGAFGDEAPRVRRLYFEIVDRSMKELGQNFLILEGWREPMGEAIAACARFVPTAEAILPAYRPGARIDPIGAGRILHDRPVIHTLAPGDMAAFRPEIFAAGPYGFARPAFAWAWGDPAQLAFPFPSGAVLVSPAELGVLLRERCVKLPLQEARLIEPGSVWRYWDRGEDLGGRWRSPSFDDAAWPSGPAPLGYGDPVAFVRTTISFGADPEARHPCAYFRRRFRASDAARIRALFVELIRDDGCVVYLNGEELARSNMPAGEIRHGTFAASDVWGAAEMAWQILAVDPRHLRDGENAIAVEIHQSCAASPDLRFDLGLVGYRAPAGGEEGG